MEEPQHELVLEKSSKDKELLDEAVDLLRGVIKGYRISDKCKCCTCAAGKFLNEIV